MKIISKFKDYYDYYAYLGIDPKIVYVRKSFWDKREIIKEPSRDLYGYTRTKLTDIFSEDNNLNSARLHYVIFCGRIYYFGVIKKVLNRDIQGYPLLTWNLDKYLESFNEISRWDTWWYESKWDSVKKANGSKIECPYPVVSTVTYNSSTDKYEYYKNEFCVNPRLKDLKFYKVISPEKAWQELSMYLSKEEDKRVHTDDKYKILAHGMDKTSFRRDKHPNKPRKKRKNINYGKSKGRS